MEALDFKMDKNTERLIEGYITYLNTGDYSHYLDESIKSKITGFLKKLWDSDFVDSIKVLTAAVTGGQVGMSIGSYINVFRHLKPEEIKRTMIETHKSIMKEHGDISYLSYIHEFDWDIWDNLREQYMSKYDVPMDTKILGLLGLLVSSYFVMSLIKKKNKKKAFEKTYNDIKKSSNKSKNKKVKNLLDQAAEVFKKTYKKVS